MSRGKKILLIVFGSLAGLFLLAFIAGVIIVQTQWFRDTVRQKIVAAVEDSTGGRAEIGSFSFDWHHLRAVIQNFVVHGSEPADDPPLLQAKLIQVDLKLTSPFKNFVDIAYLLVDTPRVDVIVQADGSTNIPSPKIKHSSDKTGLETVVDLAIGKFDLRGGVFTYSPEMGTGAFTRFETVSPAEKEARRAEIMAIQAGISRARNGSYVGRVLDVLIEQRVRPGSRTLTGRTRFQAPEVDGRVLLSVPRGAPGPRRSVVRAEITSAGPYDLRGRLVP